MNRHEQTFSLIGRLRSGMHALEGIVLLIRTQHNARVHAFATICVLGAGIFLGVSPWEWCALILVITLVWVTEGMNTAIEYLCDLVSPEFHPLVKNAKDVAAGAVLVSAVGAIGIGLVVFMPRLLSLI